MEIIYLGKELDNRIEHELFSDNDFGFDVKIEYNNGYRNEIARNMTEVHYLYKSWIPNKKSIAFESDIHETGFNHDISEISKIEISYSKKKHEFFTDYL